MNRKKRYFFTAIVVLVLVVAALAERAQSQQKYPSRPIEVIVPFGAGGGTDLKCRIFTAYLNKKWGVPVNVVNKPGAGTILGTHEVYKAPPDGYTMLGDSSSSCSALGSGGRDLPFKIMDRTFVSIATYDPMVMYMPFTSSQGLKTLEDFVAYAKKNPDKVSVALQGGLTTSDLNLRQLFKDIGVDISKAKTVAASGASDQIAMIGGGHVMIACSGISAPIPAIKGNLIRGVLITSKERHPLLPDVPTSGELGYPKVNIGNWIGISGPPNLPSPIVEVWEKAMEEMMKDPEIISKVRDLGGMPFYHNARSAKNVVQMEMETYKRVLEK